MIKSILTVDDEPSIRELLRRFLGRRGYTVSVAANSEEALRRLEEDRPDLAVIDLDLGDENGLELLILLKERRPDLPVIILTARGFEEELFQQALERGADGYVSKTLPLDQLLMEIFRVVKYNHPALPIAV